MIGADGMVGSTLLRCRRNAVLQPYAFSGYEEHFVPLRPELVSEVDVAHRRLLASLPKGMAVFRGADFE